jgi:hypothetical protein
VRKFRFFERPLTRSHDVCPCGRPPAQHPSEEIAVHYDFSQVEDIESFVSIPEGPYYCRVAEVREGVSRDGSPRWNLRLEVSRGEYAGRTAGWDSLTWSERGIRRVKRVLGALGLDVRGAVEVQPADLLHREAHVLFEPEEREDPLTGRRSVRLRVPYAGFTALDGGDGASPAGREDEAGLDGGRGR